MATCLLRFLPALLVAVCLVRGMADAALLSDLSDLPKLEQLCVSAARRYGKDAATRREFAVIASRLKNAPSGKRPSVLHALGEQAKWGTPERAAVYCTSVWYGVDYTRRRDYLLNLMFWQGPGIRPDRRHWDGETIQLVYALYEHNHDFRLLHDLLTMGTRDSKDARAWTDVWRDAWRKHPRGMLHVADMSGRGREVVLDTLTGVISVLHSSGFFLHPEGSEIRLCQDAVRRVAGTRGNPLAGLSKDLLLESGKLTRKPTARVPLPPLERSRSELVLLKGFDTLQQRLARVSQAMDAGADVPANRELSLISSTLKRANPDDRVAVLYRLVEETKWGSPERAVACYVCAWYGVNYERCRDYLLNAFFWYERGFARGRKHVPGPQYWSEETVPLLRQLHERNHDQRILQDLVSGRSDGAGAMALDSVRVDAIRDHPRAVLEAAGMSGNGRRVVLEILTDRWSGDVGEDTKHRIVSALESYLHRVSSDAKDPLSPLAKDLLQEAERLTRKLR